VCGDLLNVFLKKSLSFQSLILGYVNEFVCKQPKISRAIQANNDAVPAVTPPLSALSRPTCFAIKTNLGAIALGEKFEYQWQCENRGYRTSGLSCTSSSPVPLSVGQRRDPFDR
jgi:hypothetical protein